jgi:heat shock 70kDa protein 4
LVAFGPRQREAAETQETSNFKNTIGSLKRLIARTLNDRQVQDIEKKSINAKLVDVKGSVVAEVSALFF